MTTKTANLAVEYTGYNPQTGRCSFSVPPSWGTGIPTPNARLIAAAPELLEALEEVLADAEGYARTHGAGPSAAKRIRARCDRARAAIAKAKGL